MAITEPSSESSSGTLPFTGLEVGVIALVAIGLLVAGMVLFRLTRRPQTTV